jgi:hypothetical protein
MSADPSCVKARPALRSATLLALAALACANAEAMTGGGVAAAFRGEWVAAKAACTAPLRLQIAADTVTFVNGSLRVEFRKLEQCFSCMGRDVQNITLLTTDAMGDSPFTITLDGSRKAPAASIDFSNDKSLGKRFPFGPANLKRCP